MAIYDPNKKQNSNNQSSTVKPNETGFLQPVHGTLVDFGERFTNGMQHFFEGVIDLGIGVAGGVAGLFDKGAQDKLKAYAEKDNLGELFEKTKKFGDENTIDFLPKMEVPQDYEDPFDDEKTKDQSFFRQNKAGEFLGDVVESLGYQAPSVGVGWLAEGAGAGTAAVKAAKLASMGASAAGNSTVEAFKDDASYGRGLAYGLAQGATEVATEFISNGIPFLDRVNPLGEAVEEAASAVVNPLEKAIYKGKVEGFMTPEHWKEIGLSAAEGAVSAGIMNVASGNVGKESRAISSISEAQTLEIKRRNLDISNKSAGVKKATLQIQKNYMQAEKALQSMSKEKRASFFKENKGLSAIFTEDGKIRPEFARKTWGGQSAAETANGAQAQNAGLSEGQKRYVSVNARYDGEKATNAVKALQDALDKRGKGETAEIYSGELSSEQEETYSVAKRIVNNLNQATGDDMALIVVGGENDFNALNEKNGNAILISEKTLAKTHGAVDALAKILFEEATHSTQSRNAIGQYTSAWYAALVHELATGNSATMEAITARLLADGNGYGFTQEMLEGLESKLDSKEILTAKEQELLDEIGAQTVGEILGGNKEIVEKYASNKNAAEKILGIFGKIKKALSRATNKTAREERARVERVEGMLLNALAEKGLTYKNGKVISARPPEEKEEGNERFNRSAPIDLSDDTELSQRIGDKTGSAKHKIIQQYVLESLPGEITLSDGINATVDSRDALHISEHHSADKGAAEVSKIREIVETAKPYAYEDDVDHGKFSYFRYYQAFVKYKNDTFPVYVNVGLTRNNDGYKIYDLTEKIRDTAHLLKGVGRLPNGSITLGNGILDNSVPQTSENVNPKSEKISSISQIEQKYKDETKYLLLNEGEDTIKISNMVVKEEYRGKGIGQQILSDVISYADSVGKTITLTPTQEYGTYERLKNWYKKNGFVENKGRNADLRISDTMYRAPVTAADQQNIRFSLPIGNSTVTGKVEQTKNLVALHNLTEQNLLDTIKLGGFPAPSIAIVKAEQGHSDYGPITVVFGKETIDPQSSVYNNVFGLDAWTPTYPKIEYKPSEKVQEKIRKKYYDLARRFGDQEARPLYNYVYDMERQLDNARGENGLLQKIYDDPNIQNLYLQDTGKGKVADVYSETTTTMPKERVDYLQSFIDFIGKDAIKDLEVPAGETIFGHRKAYLNKYRDQIIQFVADHDYVNTPAEQRVEMVKEDFKDIDLLRIVLDARKYLNEGATKTTREYDQSATEAEIKKAVDQEEYRAWVDDLFGGIEEKSGIRNNRDAYTSSGSRRSFEALHYENTLENVIKKMREDNLVGENTVFSGHGIWGVSAKRYGSIGEIKADENRLQKVNEDDYKALKQSFGERLNEIANSIADDRESNAFIALDNAMENIIDAIRTKKTKSGMLNYLQQYNPKASLQTVDDIVSLVSDIAEMPTGYFEAKPMRAVTFDEIKDVLIPAGTSDKLIRALKENNIPYDIYGSTDEERSSVLQGMEDIRFSRAPQTDTPEFKRWFGDSKVVNADGTPKVVYHGTSNEFWSFDIHKSNDKLGRMMGLGSGKDKIYLTEYKASAQAAANSSKSRGRGGIERVLPLYVSANKVLDKSDYRQMLESAYEKYPNSDPRKSGYDYTQRDKAIAEVDRNIRKQGYDCVWDKESGELFVFSPTQVKSATDNIGTFDSSNPDIRFSRGLNARVAANNTGERVFSKKVAKAAIETIMESNLVFGDEYSTLRGTIRGKGRIIDELFYKLNRTQNRDYQRAVANSIADQIIDSTVLTETYSAFAEQDAANIEQAKRIAEMMSGYRHGIKFKNIEGDVKYAKDDRWAGYKLQWAAQEGDPLAISADQLVDAFDEIGVKIDAVNDAEIFLEAMRLYENARETINNAVYKVKLSEYGSEEELARLKKTISDEIMSVFENGGERSKFSKMVSRYTDQIKFMREMWKVSKKVSEIKMEGKRFASDTRSPQLNAATSLLKGMTRGSNLIPGRAREVCRNLAAWYSPENNLFKAAEGETDERGEGIKTNRFFNPQIHEMMETIGNGEGGLTAAEITDLSHIMDFMANFAKTYKRVFQNGRYVDADTIAEADISLARKAKHGYARNAVVRFVQKTAEDYGMFVFDPATVARMADGYRNGFFTHLHEEMREAALQMAAVRYELQTAQSEFYKEHKGYAPEKRIVTVRGVEMPADFAISLYMTAKRKQSWLGLVQSGYRLFLEDGEVSAKALGAKDEVYTDEQLADIVKGFRSEIDRVLTDTDRAYIATVEGVLKRAGELKMERDIQRMGFTNATEDYYYPILRAHMAKEFDANLTLGKSGYFDTVTNLSMNKDTVKNNAELGIQSVNQVISRHIDQTAMYYGLSNMVDNFNMLSNLNLSDNPGKPETMLRTANESIFGKKAMQYFQKMLKDLEGVYYADPSEKSWNRRIDKLRSNAAVAAIAANPKVIATQFSSLFAGTAILSPRDLAKGITLTKVGKYSDVDKYSEVARLRNANLEAARAETITDKFGKLGEFGMRPVAATDRLVVQIEFGACQAYVERTQGLAIGTEENLVAAGKLLNRVINETQQGANLTERSAMARSSNPIYKGLAMFRNDAVKQIGRVIDGFGELGAIKDDLRTETDAAKIEELKGRQKTVRRKTAKAVGALVGASMYQALIGLLFAAFLNRLKDKEKDEITRDVVVDSVAGLFTGLPIISQSIEFFTDGYGVEDFTISSFNDLLQSTQDMGKVIGGKATEGEVKSAIRGAIYSGGKLLGIPTRNAYNYFYGTVNTINEYAGYQVHGLLYSDNYKSELYKALNDGNTDRAQMLGSLLVDSSFGGYSKATKDAIKPLVAAGYTVLPRTVGDSVTYDGQEYKLSSRQKARFQKVYGQASAAVQKVVALQSYRKLSDEVKAKTIKRIYDMYYNLAIDDLLGTDTEDKTVLFSYAIDPDKLALIVAQAQSLQADTDKNGNAIAGSKKQKVVAYISGLKLTPAQKYMIMGYLGYRNAKGEEQVKAYINRIGALSKAEKKSLFEYSGYAA